METLVFATLLFCAYFCFACWFFYNPSTTTADTTTLVAAVNLTATSLAQRVAFETESATTLKEELEEDAIEEPAAAIEEETVEDQEPEPVQAEVEESTKESQTSPTIEQRMEGIDLDKLQLRPARKIAGKLNIQQKVNGKDQPLSFLRAQIKKRLNEQPQEVAPMIQEILRAS